MKRPAEPVEATPAATRSQRKRPKSAPKEQQACSNAVAATATATVVAAVVGGGGTAAANPMEALGPAGIGEAVKKLVLDNLSANDLTVVASKMTIEQLARAVAKRGYIVSQNIVII